jgi:F-type H+-transporting ATPase subunit gamma
MPTSCWPSTGSAFWPPTNHDQLAAVFIFATIVADEAPAVLLRLTRQLNGLLARDEFAGYGLSALYQCDVTGDLRLRHLLPLRDLPAPEPAYPYPAELHLPPIGFLRGLTGHYLHAVLNEVLYSSLLAENRQRQAHMNRALHRLEDDSARLRLRYNTQRQEEITEEIELILLSAAMLGEAEVSLSLGMGHSSRTHSRTETRPSFGRLPP